MAAVYLIAHTAPDGRNPAQAAVEASSEAAARALFAARHSDRVITATGVKT